jgi:HEAT repeat protein
VRIAAVRALGKIGDPEVIPKLTECLDRDEVPLTLAVIDAFLNIESPKAVPVLIVLIRHENEKVRYAALDAMAALPDPSATTIILDFLKTASPKEKVKAASVLGSLDDIRAVPALIDMLEDNASGVRAASARALNRITCIGPGFDADADGEKRKEVLKSLRKWWKKAEPLGREGWLIDGLNDWEDKTRASCVRGLFRHGTKKAIPALIAALWDRLSGVRESASAALIRIVGLDFGFEPSAKKEERGKQIALWKKWWRKNSSNDKRGWMLDALTGGIPDNRRRAAGALVKYKDAEVVNALADALEDKMAGVRATAILSLRKITKAHFGFDPNGTGAERRTVVITWREFLKRWK